MLPFDRKPWAKALAGIVIVLSTLGAIYAAYFLYSTNSLHVPEVVGLILLLLTIIPPNASIMTRRPEDPQPGPLTPTSTTKIA